MRKHKRKANIIINIITFKWLFALPVLFYRYCMSPLMPHVCPYYPSCSMYMLDSIHKHGIKGAGYGMARLFRCMPWTKGGFDPVPVKKRDYLWLV